jgi:hypothetical protein
MPSKNSPRPDSNSERAQADNNKIQVKNRIAMAGFMFFPIIFSSTTHLDR